MMEDKRMENRPEEDERKEPREPMTIHDRIYLALLALVTALWCWLLVRAVGWVIWLIKALLW